MWTKEVRLAVCSSIYEDIFWNSVVAQDKTVTKIDEDFIEDVVKNLTKEDVAVYESTIKTYKSNQKEYYLEVLKPYIEDWKKTFDIVQAILISFILEREYYTVHNETIADADYAGKYIKVTQDLVGGGNTGLVHAIISKITGQITTKESIEEQESNDQP
jgi:hypothetical protein